MTELIEFDNVESLGAGAFGVPGQRTFLVQACRRDDVLSVLLEKEQVRILAKETLRFLERLDHDHPDAIGEAWGLDGSVREAIPQFRARMLGIGFDPDRSLMVIELREWPEDEVPDEEAPEPRVARIFATRAQARAMAKHAMEAVDAGRPNCQLCDLPMDPTGHWCPRSN
jgi:uncharacterized repeat protein (TIGR03847 family)